MKQAKVDESIEDAKNVKWFYFPKTKFFGAPESEEGLKEVEDSYQKLCDVRFANGNTWLVGDAMTLADLVLAVSLSMAVVIGQYDVAGKYPALMKERLTSLSI